MWRKTVFQNKDKILSVERELLGAEATNEAKNKEIQKNEGSERSANTKDLVTCHKENCYFDNICS